MPHSDSGEKENKAHSACASQRDRKPSSLVSLVTRLCAAHSGTQSHLLVQQVPSPPPPTFPLSLFSPYCPLAHFPQCYKLQTTQTSRPNALPWTPSKLHFLESQGAGFIDNTGHTVRLSIYTQEVKAQDGPFTGPKDTSGGFFFFLQSADGTLLCFDFFSSGSVSFQLAMYKTHQ